jgi:hypothetical protein
MITMEEFRTHITHFGYTEATIGEFMGTKGKVLMGLESRFKTMVTDSILMHIEELGIDTAMISEIETFFSTNEWNHSMLEMLEKHLMTKFGGAANMEWV